MSVFGENEEKNNNNDDECDLSSEFFDDACIQRAKKWTIGTQIVLQKQRHVQFFSTLHLSPRQLWKGNTKVDKISANITLSLTGLTFFSFSFSIFLFSTRSAFLFSLLPHPFAVRSHVIEYILHSKTKFTKFCRTWLQNENLNWIWVRV